MFFTLLLLHISKPKQFCNQPRNGMHRYIRNDLYDIYSTLAPSFSSPPCSKTFVLAQDNHIPPVDMRFNSFMICVLVLCLYTVLCMDVHQAWMIHFTFFTP
ncbi:hypothetical protein BO99DRAFT_56114 [Aspergillus violaceofuscus CBS 115571]|uniref:Uncharacterized protein n=1 Tax=Aspergillus violaceofuscus (strain CBS 115571) TaxID=1450538 RepID=A0A2V5GYS2_ASPV1|nr:hypothetical protein BO99DRAFT_56114 [Aspergillus violaceofuscus CBS 115571]